MKIKTILKSAGLILALLAYAQMVRGQNMNAAVNTSGGSMSNGTMTVEYSVGEAVATPSVNTRFTTGSGVIQSTYVRVATNEAFDKQYQLRAYPNPVGEMLTIETDYKDFTTVEIFNLLGQRIASKAFDYQPIAMGALPTGEYLIVLRGPKNLFFKSIKIIKQ